MCVLDEVLLFICCMQCKKVLRFFDIADWSMRAMGSLVKAIDKV